MTQKVGDIGRPLKYGVRLKKVTGTIALSELIKSVKFRKTQLSMELVIQTVETGDNTSLGQGKIAETDLKMNKNILSITTIKGTLILNQGNKGGFWYRGDRDIWT